MSGVRRPSASEKQDPGECIRKLLADAAEDLAYYGAHPSMCAQQRCVAEHPHSALCLCTCGLDAKIANLRTASERPQDATDLR